MEEEIHVPSLRDFHVIKLIGNGAFGRVSLIVKLSNQRLYALKSMSKDYLFRKNMAHQIMRERNILALSNCVFIVPLFYSFETEDEVHLVMEYMNGGDFSTILRCCGCFEEIVATFYISEVALAMDYLHGHDIIHRDIKPSNFLMSNRGHLKLADFGLVHGHSFRKPEIEDFFVKKNSNEPEFETPVRQTSAKCDVSHKLTRTPGQVRSLTSNFLDDAQLLYRSSDMNRISTNSNQQGLENSVTFESCLNDVKESANDNTYEPCNTNQPEFFRHHYRRMGTNKLSRNGPNYSETYCATTSVLGTPDYLAPEVIQGLSYDLNIDWWSLGVCLYEFVVGFPPFNDESVEIIFDNILRSNFLFPSGDESLSPDVVSAINAMLQSDPLMRANLKELKIMPFFKTINWSTLHECEPPLSPKNNGNIIDEIIFNT